jgi:hypothetical protein
MTLADMYERMCQTRYAESPLLGHDRNGMAVRRGDIVPIRADANRRIGDVLESFTRWLARPTLEERFIETEMRALRVLADEGIENERVIVDYRHAQQHEYYGRPSGFTIDVPSIGAEMFVLDGSTESVWDLFREVVRERLCELGRKALSR